MSCSRCMITLLLGPLATIGTYTNNCFTRSIGCNTTGCGRKIPQKLKESLSTPMTDDKSLLVCILRERPLNLLVLAMMSEAGELYTPRKQVSWETSPGLTSSLDVSVSGMASRPRRGSTTYCSQRFCTPRHRGEIGSNACRCLQMVRVRCRGWCTAIL